MKRRETERYLKWLFTFAGSFIVGILIMNIGRYYFLSDDGILNFTTLSRIKYLNVNGTMLLRYTLFERFKIVFILIIFSTTFIGICFSYIFVAWQGVLAGMLLSASVIRYGFRGIILVLAGIFPQQLLLVPAWIMLLNWCYQLCCKFYFPHKDVETSLNQRHYLVRKSLILLWIIGVVIIGCILESYVNPIVLTEAIKIF